MVVTDDPSPSSFVRYGIDDKPPLPIALLLDAQHYLTIMGTSIAIPLIFAGALGTSTDVIPWFIGMFFVIFGIVTLMQTTFGDRYPIVQGVPLSTLAPALVVIGVTTATDQSNVAWQSVLL